MRVFFSSLFACLYSVLISAAVAYAAGDTAVEGGADVSIFSMQGLEAFINTKWGQYALIAVFFGMIIMYLRVLFGPKGFFREKRWDEMNEEFRAKEAAEKAAQEALQKQE